MRDNSLKHTTKSERDANAKRCGIRVSQYFAIWEGEFHRCTQAYYRMKTGIMPYYDDEYIDLLENNFLIEENKKKLISMLSLISAHSCAYCNGLREDSVRVLPAEQLL